jgi:hypothetical protein
LIDVKNDRQFMTDNGIDNDIKVPSPLFFENVHPFFQCCVLFMNRPLGSQAMSSVNVQASYLKGIPLHLAIQERHTGLIGFLIDGRSNLDIRHHQGENAVFLAVRDRCSQETRTRLDRLENDRAGDRAIRRHHAASMKWLHDGKCLRGAVFEWHSRSQCPRAAFASAKPWAVRLSERAPDCARASSIWCLGTRRHFQRD